jgi:hypothetical protein
MVGKTTMETAPTSVRCPYRSVVDLSSRPYLGTILDILALAWRLGGFTGIRLVTSIRRVIQRYDSRAMR